MDVADEIVVINQGRIEQVGSPDELYDSPANEFVMSFLGPVTRLGGTQYRPHDLEILSAPAPGAIAARVVRVVRLGFEVRVDALGPSGDEVWVQLTRAQAQHLRLQSGDEIWLRPAMGTAPAVSAR